MLSKIEKMFTYQQQSYHPFGMALQTYIAEANLLGYNGQEKQAFALNGSALDWLDYGARFYNQQIARFHTRNPLCEKFNYMSSYAYAANNPIHLIDVFGLALGELFKTIELIARDFVKCYNDNFIPKRVEFGTHIYQIKNGKFSYGIPVLWK